MAFPLITELQVEAKVTVILFSTYQAIKYHYCPTPRHSTFARNRFTFGDLTRTYLLCRWNGF